MARFSTNMTRKLLTVAALATASVAVAPAYAATVINVSGTANASIDGSNAVTTALGAGTYRVTFTQGAFTSFSRFDNVSGCNAAGASCTTGFENSARLSVNGGTIFLGDGAASGGIGPIAGGGYFADAATAFAHSSIYSTTFTLTAPGTFGAYLYDDGLSDNQGGVSLSVAAVPEPATWAMMLMGFGMMGFGLRRRSNVKTTVTYA